MTDFSKLDAQLRALVTKVVEVDPSFAVRLVVDADEAATREPVVESILAAGGTVEDREGDRLQCTVPIGKIQDLADQEAVSAIRLSRRHRMHSKKRW